MPFTATVLRFLVASPSDTKHYRAVVRQIMEDWTALHAEAQEIVLIPLLWERDATPEAGDRPQALLNAQLLHKADGLVAVFWTRLGSPTGESESGTVEEIGECISAGKPVLLYFSSQPVELNSVDGEELQRLTRFRERIQDSVLYDTFADSDELGRKLFAALTRLAHDRFRLAQADPDLNVDASRAAAPTTPPDSQPRANPVGAIDRERELRGFNRAGSPRYANNYALVITNQGGAVAENFTFRFEKSNPDEDDKTMLPQILAPVSAATLAPTASLRYPLAVVFGTAPQVELVMTWQERGEERTATQTLRI